MNENETKRRLAWWKRIGFGLITSILLLVIVEGALRVVGFRYEPRSTPLEFLGFSKDGDPHPFLQSDPELFWRLRPGVPLDVAPGFERVSSLGFRGWEIATAKADGAVRIAILGDSCVFGWGIPFRDTFACRVERRLRSRGIEAEIVNAGVPGYSSLQSVRRFERDVLALDPDVVILYAGQWNEFTPAVGKPDHEKNVQWSESKESLRLDRLRFGGVRTLQALARITAPLSEGSRARRIDRYKQAFQQGSLIDGPRVPLNHFRSNLERLLSRCADHGVIAILLPGPAPEESLRWFPIEEYRQAMRELEDDGRAVVVEVESDLRAAGSDEEMFDDWIHPSSVGNEIIARRLYEALVATDAPGLATAGAFDAPPKRRSRSIQLSEARRSGGGKTAAGSWIEIEAPGRASLFPVVEGRGELRIELRTDDSITIRVELIEPRFSSGRMLLDGEISGAKHLRTAYVSSLGSNEIEVSVEAKSASSAPAERAVVQVRGKLTNFP